jgi:adenosylcobyric acid synthase
MKALMFMGTGSDVGKSLIVAGIARLLSNRGLRVAPFKPQNMSNNAAVTADGGEIGRAQALQARAARLSPSVHMNPVLLKPESPTGAQIVVQGKRVAKMSAREFFAQRPRFMPAILDSFDRLKSAHDLVLVEGAGSPAEINLRDGDLANMGFAQAAKVPAILVGDIHRGGVIASIAGTFDILGPDSAWLKAFLINKFHGDPALFEDGRAWLESRTKTPCLGVIPHFEHAWKLPAEDAVALENMASTHSDKTKIALLQLPRIANFDDLDPLRMEPGVNLVIIKAGDVIPGDTGLVIIPGSKSTIADLAALRANGWEIDLKAHVRRGGHVLGLCGGYQMLGKRIGDPANLEGGGMAEGLGFLDVNTELQPEKQTVLTQAIHAASGHLISGYEIHLGVTTGPDCASPFSRVNGKPEGATSPNGRIQGTYLHGAFTQDAFRSAYLKSIGAESSTLNADAEVDATLDALAAHIGAHTDIEALLKLAK